MEVIPMRRLVQRALDIWTGDFYTTYSWEEFLEHIIAVWKLGARAGEFRRAIEQEVGQS